MNNQENSNEVSKAKNDLQKLVAEILLHKTMLSGTKIREVSELISQSVELNYKSIDEPITDKEIDAEIERYIKQFWPRPEHGGAVRLGFKRAVRWMQERQSNEPINFEDNIDTVGNCANCGVEFHIHKEKTKNEPISQRDYELLSRGRFDNPVPDNVEPVKNDESLSKVQVDYYEDKIEMLQRLIAERDKTIADFNEPIKDEKLKTANEFLYESGVDTMSMQDGFNCQLFYAMERYAEQYAASKLNNSAGVWIKASERLPEKENDYFIINNGYKSVASFIKGDGFYRMGDKESRVSRWLDESKLNNTIEDKSQLLCVGRRVKVDTEYYTVTSVADLDDSVLFNLQNGSDSLRIEIKK